jgi:flagellar biosynthesis chaperone FliJ
MPVSRALRRLLGIRELEEEQCRAALESAVTERARLQKALDMASERGRRGRALIAKSARSGELCDRLAGLEEVRSVPLLSDILSERIAAAELHVTERYQDYLSSRTRRRQVETLNEDAEKKVVQLGARRSQQEMDEWFRSRA